MNKFIAGVGNVTLFKGNDLILTAKTLVDTSINFSVTLEDIRAGQGAKLYGKYAHTTGMTMKLTDAMWRLEMLAANIGADIANNAGTAIKTIQATVADGKFVIPAEVKTAAQPLIKGGKDVYVWYAPVGSSDDGWSSVKVDEIPEEGIAIVGEEDGVLVCIKYIESNAADRTITVSGNFIPDTLTAIVEVPVFAGDSSGQLSTRLGKVVITIPRFMLNGTMDLSMTMTGASQTAIEGSALAVTSADCLADEDYYAIISEVIDNAKPYDNVKAIAIDAEDGEITAAIGETLTLDVYAVFSNGLPKLLPYDAAGVNGYALEGVETTDGSIVVPEGGATVTVKFAPKADVEFSDEVVIKVPTV